MQEKEVHFNEEAATPEARKTVEELFHERSQNFKSQFVMDKSTAATRKL